jgi:two-component system nitrogen regulation sensor histidine kinase NtrY
MTESLLRTEALLPRDFSELAALRDAFFRFAQSATALSDAYRELEARTARVEGELARANASLRAIFESIPSGVIARDSQGRVTAVNRAAEAILGIDAAKLFEQPSARETLRDARGDFLLAAAPAPISPETTERTIELGNGRRLVLLWTRTALPAPGGGAPGSLEVFTDLTELRALQREAAARERLATLGETAAALAHQIRSPLNGFQGFLALLLRQLSAEPAESPARRYAEKLLEGARELERIVAGFLAYARPEALCCAPVSLRPLFESIERAFVDMGRAKKDAIEIDVEPATLAVEGDPVALKQVFWNLLENALEATEGTGPVRLRARETPFAGTVFVEVEDEGPGIPKELFPRLFQPFATGRPRGSGLGLAVVRKLLDLQGGSVRAKNLSPRGARFTVELRARASAGKKKGG